MKPWETVALARLPDGTELALRRHPAEIVIDANGRTLMSSRMHGSEEALAHLGCRQARTLTSPVVLIGGLGMGFSLRAALDILPQDATVLVAELVPAVIEWNRGPLGPLAGHPLDDPRVQLEAGDVADVIRASATNRRRFDAILLDVDNGPIAMSSPTNAALYDRPGLTAARAALRPGGTLALWSATEEPAFERRLIDAGFSVQRERVPARLARGGPRHTILIARARTVAAGGDNRAE